MPRLSKRQYQQAHERLKCLWFQDQGAFNCLTPTEQWQLHDFFSQPKDLSREALLAHREAVTKERPSLPHQAGRALAKLEQLLAVRQSRPAEPEAAPIRGHRQQVGVITARSVVRSEPDMQKLVRVFELLIAKQAAQRQKNSQEPEQSRD